ncbi:hypothetical protein FRB91_005994 [Serendipita sp. 411]|nr:hypothetical protein FRC15_007164 [Serendipita sp. 397]KAG8768371.1 hypothetical protein FRC16_007070 [Serendipita sp. 398]KAG8799281.1 hypothetical protein FRC18_008339 [Serendipita sp. 400]KAG8832923.1 hypothetical protein FRC20_007780 [Serendipita sp. 405]KAG8840501.1 hypothetical protein FRB91_005994 [Serendipita sp. 411]
MGISVPPRGSEPIEYSRELVFHNKWLDWTDAFVRSSLTIDGTSHPDLPFYMSRPFKQEMLVIVDLNGPTDRRIVVMSYISAFCAFTALSYDGLNVGNGFRMFGCA